MVSKRFWAVWVKSFLDRCIFIHSLYDHCSTPRYPYYVKVLYMNLKYVQNRYILGSYVTWFDFVILLKWIFYHLFDHNRFSYFIPMLNIFYYATHLVYFVTDLVCHKKKLVQSHFIIFHGANKLIKEKTKVYMG